MPAAGLLTRSFIRSLANPSHRRQLVFDLCQSDGRPLDEDVLPPPHLHRSPASPRSEESDHIRSLPRRNSSSCNGRPASLSAASLASEDAMLDSLGPEPSAGCSCSTQPDDCSTVVERVGVAGGSGGGARTSCSLGGGGCECIEASVRPPSLSYDHQFTLPMCERSLRQKVVPQGFFYEPKEDKQPLLKEGKPGVHRHEPRRHHRRRSHSPSPLSTTAVPSKPPFHPRTSPSLSSSSPTFLTSRRERPHQPRLRLPHPPHLPLVECGPGCACPSAIALEAVSLTSVIGSTLQDGWRRPKALLPRPSSSTCANRPTQGKPHPCVSPAHRSRNSALDLTRCPSSCEPALPARNLVLGRSPLGQLGLFAPTCSSSSQTPAIRAGSFICTYAGELLSTSEARERWAQQADRQEGNYIFSLRENGRPTVHIDPTRIGGIGSVCLHSRHQAGASD